MDAFTTTKQAPVIRPRLSWQSISYFLLLAILLNSMVVGVTGVIKNLNAEVVRPIILAAMILSWILSLSRAKRWLIVTLTILIGFGLVFTAIGNLWNEWGEIFRWVTYYAVTLFRAILHNIDYPSTGPIVFALTDLGEKLGILFVRLGTWILTLPQPSPDVFATGLVWSLGMWFTAIWATWFTHQRNQPLSGALPIIIMVGALRTITHSSANIMLTTLGTTLALLVIVSQNLRERNWKEKSVGFSHIIQRNSTLAAIILSVTLVISAEIISSIDFDDLMNRFREPELTTTEDVNEEDRTGVEYEESSEITGIVDEFRRSASGGLPNSNLIGSGPELSDRVMMHVKLEEVDPETGDYFPVEAEITPYFRALAYEEYSHQGWTANAVKVYGYKQSLALIETYTTNQRLYHLEAEHVEDLGGILHSVGELASIDSDYYISWRERDKAGNLVDMFGGWIIGDSYQAFSIAPIYGENELRESQPRYPDWVTERYLQLPDSVPERVLDLAREITFSYSTPYDSAVAIERYLRSYPYTLDLPDKPASVDIADYFLFELKKGYCDYYATSMVVLARAVGLPARFVSGYIGGTYDEENGYYVVTADQAHAWVEVYFPEHGWIAFEPTAGRSAIDRIDILEDEPIEELTIDESNPEPVEETDAPTYSSMVPFAIGIIVFLGFSGFFLWVFVDERVMRRQPPVKVFAKIYRRLKRASKKLDLEIIESHTPSMFSAAIQERMTELAKTNPYARFLQSAPKEIKWIVEQSILAAYSPNPPDKISRYRAIKSWGILRWQFALGTLIVKFSYLKSRVTNTLQRNA